MVGGIAGHDGEGRARRRRTVSPVPLPPVGVIRRDRLTDLFESAATGSMILVSAPAGWGKTTAVSEWARAADFPVAWVECDQDDSADDFWDRVRETLAEALGTDVESAEPVPDQAEQNMSGVRQVRAALTPLEHVQGAAALVLDDFHVLRGDRVHATINQLLGRLPANLLLVIASRSDPVIVLHKFRTSGRVREVRADDLAFTPYETERLLEANHVTLSNRDIDRLCARMEGWATGLRLSLTPIAHATDSSQVVDTLVGNDSSIAGYLVEQVLNQLKPEDRDFLLDLSVVDRFNLELAEALTGRDDCAARLTRMASTGGFMTTDPEHQFPYRFHALYRTLLQNELRYADAERARSLGAIAARWYRTADLIHSAMDCALAAHDWDLAGDVLIDVASIALAEGDPASAARHLDGFATGAGALDVRVLLTEILLTLIRGDYEASAQRLEHCRPALAQLTGESGARAELLHRLLIAGVGCFRGQGGEILASLGPDEDFIVVGGSPVRATTGDTARRAVSQSERAYALLINGQLRPAAVAANASMQLSDHQIGRVELHGRQVLAVAAVCRGDLESADQKSRAALALISALPSGRTFDSAILNAVCGWVDLERGDYQAAESHLLQAGAITPEGKRLPISAQLVHLVRARFDSLVNADPTVALAAVRGFDEWYATAPARPYAFDVIRGQTLTHSLLRMGRHRAALEAITDSPQNENADLARALVLARALLYDPASVEPNLLGEVRSVVRGIEDGPADSATYVGWRIRLLLTVAVLEFQLLDKNRASHLLHLTFPATESDGWRLPFLELGAPLMPLLLRDRGRINAHADILNHLIHELGRTPRRQSGALVVALSEREIEILQLLPAAYNQDELADMLFISKNTLKTHLRAIYRKLGVDSRRQAVIRAEDLRLI